MAKTEPGTVLVVDDDEIKRYTVTRILTKAGFAVEEASTGAETLDAARRNPELIILDVNLPDIHGFEVCRRLKADPATSSIVVLHFSATMTESGHKALGLEGGADGYLTEPIEAAELIATVRSMLRIRTAERTAKALAHQWQATFDAIADGICLLDDEDRVIRCNAAMAALAERTPEQLVGLTCDEVTGGALASEGSPCRRARTTRCRTLAEYERDGRWFSIAADPVVDDDGEAIGTVFIVADVTMAKERDRERAELLVREQAARAQAEAANRAKDEFLATISHELRTPLNSMLGWIALLRRGNLSEAESLHAMEVLDRNARSQAQLISDILDVSRIITGKVRLDVRRVDLAALIDAAVDSVRPGAEAKGVDLVTTTAPGVGQVIGDPERLQQVVWNLLSNAIKFTPKGGRVSVDLRAAGAQIEIVVADTGSGIDPGFLPFVFDRFRQADGSTTRVHAGLGLGLSIVRHLVELHGGTTRAESPGRGHGATFVVAIPAAAALVGCDAARPVDAADELVRPMEHMTPLDGVRVLVVDDDEDTRVMLVAVLEECHAEVKACGSAADAVAAVRVWLPDVIVSDIGMPGSDGYAMIREVRAMPADAGGRVPAVALTAYARTEDRLRALSAGFQMYVSKPAEPAELTAVVASLVERAR